MFYEGPPTANGMPHPGHCLTRAIKDLFPRYHTMRGYLCERKAGWDTHGLPVEVEVCKELGIHSKEEIEAYGIEPFIQKCQQERLALHAGVGTARPSASASGSISTRPTSPTTKATSKASGGPEKLFDRGLLYQGHKIVWWWAQGGTALSSRRSRPRLSAGG